MSYESAVETMRDPVAHELALLPTIGRLGYIGLDGFPRVVPVGVVWNFSEFVICTAPTAPKVAALRANPKAAVTIDGNVQPIRILMARGTASIELVEGVPNSFVSGWQTVIPSADWKAFADKARAKFEQMACIKIRPDEVQIFDFEERVPSVLMDLL